MIKRILRLWGIALILSTTVIALAGQEQGRGPSTAEERELAVKLARFLEQNPLHKDAKEARQWLTVWLISIPDITVKMCGRELGPARSGSKYSSELSVQLLYSSAAYIIEHPDRAKKDRAVYQAGLEGALRMYESLLVADPDARHAFLNELLEKREKDELQKYVRKATRKCK